MSSPVFLALQETTPGRYEGSWQIPTDQEVGTYSVVGFVHIGGADQAAGAACGFSINPPSTGSTAPGGPTPTVPGSGSIPPAPQVTPPTGQPQSTTDQLPEWADNVANILAYIIVFYGMVAGAAAANFKGGWIMAIAMMAIVWFLRDWIVTPLQRLVKQILLAIFGVLFELIDFLWKWLQGIAQFFQGDLLKAIERILMVAAFMWVWEWAQSIPAIAQVTTWILDTANKIISWVNSGVDFLLKLIKEARDFVDHQVEQLIGRIGTTAQQLTGEITGYVDQLFGGLSQRVQRGREEILSIIDVRTKLAHLQVTALGQTVRIVPQVIQKALLEGRLHLTKDEEQQVEQFQAELAGEVVVEPARTVGPWDVADEFMAELRVKTSAGRALWGQVADEVMGQLRAATRGEAPQLESWPNTMEPPDPPPPPDVPIPDILLQESAPPLT